MHYDPGPIEVKLDWINLLKYNVTIEIGHASRTNQTIATVFLPLKTRTYLHAKLTQICIFWIKAPQSVLKGTTEIFNYVHNYKWQFLFAWAL